MKFLLFFVILLSACVESGDSKFCRTACSKAIECNPKLSVVPYSDRADNVANINREGTQCICPIAVEIAKPQVEKQ